MFEITVFRCDELDFKDGRKLYRLWFALDTGLAWIYSSKKYDKGEKAKFTIIPANTQDTKTNFRMTLKVI